MTGATGFIGSHLTEGLLERGIRVRALVRRTSSLRWLKGLGMEFVEGDLSGFSFPTQALEGVDYVFHLAGVIEALSRKDYFLANVEGTQRLLEAVKKARAPLKKFVLVSSQAAGGPSIGERPVREEDPPHPVSFYGESKLAAEKVALEFAGEFPVVILRPPTIYGPRETRVYRAFQMMKRGFALAVGSKLKLISFCYVVDLIQAIQRAAFQAQASGQIYNVAGDRVYEWSEFIHSIGRALKKPYRLYRIPPPLLRLFGAVGEVYSQMTGRSALFTRQKVKEFVQNSWVLDGTRIRQELGWREQVSLDEGMVRTVAWYREQGWL